MTDELPDLAPEKRNDWALRVGVIVGAVLLVVDVVGLIYALTVIS
jgi:hypothetical protein